MLLAYFHSAHNMPLPAPDIERLLRAAFPDATLTLTDLAGDDDHFALNIISERFRGLSRVAQHQLVYAALSGAMEGALHALALKTAPPA